MIIIFMYILDASQSCFHIETCLSALVKITNAGGVSTISLETTDSIKSSVQANAALFCSPLRFETTSGIENSGCRDNQLDACMKSLS